MPKREPLRGMEAHQYDNSDIFSEWELRYGGQSLRIYGPLSKALYEAALLTPDHRQIKISDKHGESSFILTG